MICVEAKCNHAGSRQLLEFRHRFQHFATIPKHDWVGEPPCSKLLSIELPPPHRLRTTSVAVPSATPEQCMQAVGGSSETCRGEDREDLLLLEPAF